MDHHIKDYFYRSSSDDTPCGNFHEVIALHEAPDITWKAILSKIPNCSRGWYELAQLSTKDRIEFTRDFWLSKLPYRAGVDEFLNRFFSSLDEIGVFVTQKKFEDPYEIHLIYSIKGDNGFFRGAMPISEKGQQDLQKAFANRMLPVDYLAFLQIHNGFCKATDCTGIIAASDMPMVYVNLQQLMSQYDPIVNSRGETVDPKALIPFYESFGMPFYQCFLADWYPEGEMGNVYYSGETNTISDLFGERTPAESMTFPTFTDWLMFYLERIE